MEEDKEEQYSSLRDQLINMSDEETADYMRYTSELFTMMCLRSLLEIDAGELFHGIGYIASLEADGLRMAYNGKMSEVIPYNEVKNITKISVAPDEEIGEAEIQ